MIKSKVVHNFFVGHFLKIYGRFSRSLWRYVNISNFPKSIKNLIGTINRSRGKPNFTYCDVGKSSFTFIYQVAIPFVKQFKGNWSYKLSSCRKTLIDENVAGVVKNSVSIQSETMTLAFPSSPS